MESHESIIENKMCSIMKFLGNQDSNVDLAGDVGNDNFLEGDSLTDCIAVEVEVFHALGCGRLGPAHTSVVVILEGSGRCRVKKTKIVEKVTEGQDGFGALVDCADLSFTVAETGALLVHNTPGVGSPILHDAIAAHGVELEEGNLSSFRDGWAFYLRAPAFIRTAG